MLKLTKDQVTKKELLESEMQGRHAAMEDAINAFNAAMDEKRQAARDAIDAYNEAVSNGAKFMEKIAGEIESAINEKSEKWQESDRGQEVRAWQERWECDLEIADVELPDEVDVPDESAITELNELPNSVDD